MKARVLDLGYKALGVLIVAYTIAVAWLFLGQFLSDHTPLPNVFTSIPRPSWSGTALDELADARTQLPARLDGPEVTVTVPDRLQFTDGNLPLPQADLNGPWTGNVTVATDFAGRLQLLAAPLLAGILTLVVLVLVRRIVRAIRDGEAFQASNVRRISLIGLLVAALTPVTLVGQLLRNQLVEQTNVASAVQPYLDLPWWPLFVGLLLIVLGEVFRAGARMRDELDSVV